MEVYALNHRLLVATHATVRRVEPANIARLVSMDARLVRARTVALVLPLNSFRAINAIVHVAIRASLARHRFTFVRRIVVKMAVNVLKRHRVVDIVARVLNVLRFAH